MEIIGYKVFNSDWTCRSFDYKNGKDTPVGQTFKHNGNIEMCGAGFHFCRKASDCFNYYGFDSNNKVALVKAIGLVETEGDKSVTDELVILEEIKWQDLLNIVNEGKDCTGLCNTGDCNTGDRNTGDCNTGNRNTGDWNTGDCNTGDRNTGDCNTGDRNTGDCNTGDCNTGDRNTGDWNTGNRNTGFFNTITPKLVMFNKETKFNREELVDLEGIKILNWNYENNWWIYSENMSEKEKEDYPKYEIMGGYLKSIPFKDACILMWGNLKQEEKQKVVKLPNFDKVVFEEITGIDTDK